jgi:hypothetical protein
VVVLDSEVLEVGADDDVLLETEEIAVEEELELEEDAAAVELEAGGGLEVVEGVELVEGVGVGDVVGSGVVVGLELDDVLPESLDELASEVDCLFLNGIVTLRCCLGWFI